MKGIELREKRKKLGLTQEELAKKLGMTNRTIINYEKSEIIPKSKSEFLNAFFLKHEKETNDFGMEIDKSMILNKIRDSYRFKTDTEFADFLDIGKSTLSDWHSRNSFDIELLYSKFENINPHFLFTGKGEIVISDIRVNEAETLKENKRNTYRLKSDRNIADQYIPLYNIEASAGIVTLFTDTSQQQPVDYIQVPNLPKCDGAVYVTGDSMYPLLKSGDIVMYKQMHDIKNGLIFGEMYLISIDYDGDEIVSVKWLQKSDKGDDWIKLVSENRHHPDRDIELKRIRALAIVKASVRINSMS